MTSSLLLSPENKLMLLRVAKASIHAGYYGGKSRFTHSVVMTVLFNRKGLRDGSAWRSIWKNTMEHGSLFVKFVGLFKLSFEVARKMFPSEDMKGIITILCGIVPSILFWSKKTPINKQVCLYLMSIIF